MKKIPKRVVVVYCIYKKHKLITCVEISRRKIEKLNMEDLQELHFEIGTNVPDGFPTGNTLDRVCLIGVDSYDGEDYKNHWTKLNRENAIIFGADYFNHETGKMEIVTLNDMA